MEETGLAVDLDRNRFAELIASCEPDGLPHPLCGGCWDGNRDRVFFLRLFGFLGRRRNAGRGGLLALARSVRALMRGLELYETQPSGVEVSAYRQRLSSSGFEFPLHLRMV